jgi:hypothetical protein
MKILMIYRRKEKDSWESIMDIEKKLRELGNEVDIISREDDLNLNSLSSSMSGLAKIIEKKDKEKNYDIIYTQDWSIAFPLLIPNKILFEKHYCIFHNLEASGAQSRIMQKIVGNMLGNKLIVKISELKEKFPKAILSKDGLTL